MINGTIPDEVVILGNHRDAWLAGGAGDPNSGSAALNEVARSFGAALQKGWKPLRTTVLASWDGEEYALIGSTEFVEEFMPWLKDSAVAYLNVDVGTAGPRFGAGASPILNHLIRESTKAVQSPNQTLAGQTLADLWNGKIPTLGSGSDFTAFLDFAGVSSVDMGFHGSLEDPVYHYHSNYDSTAWMEKYGDKGYLYHLAVTQLWTIMATSLIEDPVIPFNVTDYALALASYVEKLQAQASTAGMLSEPSLNFTSLFVAIDSLQQAAIIHDAQATALRSALNYASSSWWLWWQTAELWRTARRLNTAYKRFENAFLWHEGLKGRPLFKHTLFAPDLWNGYAGVTLPGISEAIVEGNYETAQHWIGVVAERVAAAQMLLEV